MARLPYVDIETAPDRVRDAFENVPPLNVFRMVAHAESALRPFLRYGGTLLSRLELDPVLRELAILRVAVLSDCDYERLQHVPIAAAVGATDQQIATATTVGAAGDGLDGPVLRLVDELAADGRGHPDTTDELLAALGNRGLIELLLVIGQYRGLAALMNTVEIDFDQEAGVAVLESASTPRKPR
jgi:4-carboxymuconolactone decarboxylase